MKLVPSVTEAVSLVAFPKFPGHLKFVVVETIVVLLVKVDKLSVIVFHSSKPACFSLPAQIPNTIFYSVNLVP